MKTEFQFELNQKVKLKLSQEEGLVTGRAEYSHSSPMYHVTYKAADGKQTEAWWHADHLEAVDPNNT